MDFIQPARVGIKWKLRRDLAFDFGHGRLFLRITRCRGRGGQHAAHLPLKMLKRPAAARERLGDKHGKIHLLRKQQCLARQAGGGIFDCLARG